MNISNFINIFTIIVISRVDCARILGLFTGPIYSHQVVNNALMKELHSRGHEILTFTSHPMTNSTPNFTEIGMSSLAVRWKEKLNYVQTTRKDFTKACLEIGVDLCELMFDHAEVQKLLDPKSNARFDLIIISWLFTPCACGFGHHFSAPMIGLSPLGLFYSGHEAVGNSIHPVYFTEIFYPHLKNPSMLEIIERVTYYIWYKWSWHNIILPMQDRIARQYFGDTMPYIGDLQRNVSMVFTTLRTNDPRVPALIELGAIHLMKNQTMPKDLQVFLDKAPGGVIYFSFGTNVRCDKIPAAKRQMFFDAFSELKELRILWKWEGDNIPDQETNVRISKWFPQQAVLAHPKVKAFIYHGGLQSSEEAITVQVPVIGIPFGIDQEINVRKIVDFGGGIMVDFETITKDIILNAVRAVIYDKRYKESMVKLSAITKDLPQTPVETAVWWIEYVIRHKGTPYLRSAALDLSWYQLVLLDVIAFLILLFLLSILVIYFVAKLIIRYVVCKIKSEKSN